MRELEEVLRELEPELGDIGDGCEMCVQHSLDIINKAIEKRGFRYRMFINTSKHDYECYVKLFKVATLGLGIVGEERCS